MYEQKSFYTHVHIFVKTCFRKNVYKQVGAQLH